MAAQLFAFVLRGQNADAQHEVQAECCGPARSSALYQTLVRHATLVRRSRDARPRTGSGLATRSRMAQNEAATHEEVARGADPLVPRALAGRSPAPYCRAERGLGEGRGNPRPLRALPFPTAVECARETWMPNVSRFCCAASPHTSAERVPTPSSASVAIAC